MENPQQTNALGAITAAEALNHKTIVESALKDLTDGVDGKTVTNRIIDSTYEAYDGKPGLPRYPEITGTVEISIEMVRLDTVQNTIRRIVNPAGGQGCFLPYAAQSKENCARVMELVEEFENFCIDVYSFLKRLQDGNALEIGKDGT